MPPHAPRPRRRNLCLWVWYRGGRFSGFQAQPGGGSLQEAFEALLAPAGVSSRVWPAGRTDRGVHARMQVLSVRAPHQVEPSALERLQVADDLGVVAARLAPDRFHAQFSAVGKEYRYRLALGPAEPGWAPYTWSLAEEPRLAGSGFDVALFSECLQLYRGERDFIAFHEKSSGRRPRRLDAVELHQRGAILEVRLRGAAFARHMVRFLVGNAALVAAGKLSRDQLVAAVEGGVEVPGLRAEAKGLVLWEVHYPAGLDPFAAERAGRPEALAAPPFGD